MSFAVVSSLIHTSDHPYSRSGHDRAYTSNVLATLDGFGPLP